MKTICEICLTEMEGKTHNPSPIRAEVCCNECNINNRNKGWYFPYR